MSIRSNEQDGYKRTLYVMLHKLHRISGISKTILQIGIVSFPIYNRKRHQEANSPLSIRKQEKKKKGNSPQYHMLLLSKFREKNNEAAPINSLFLITSLSESVLVLLSNCFFGCYSKTRKCMAFQQDIPSACTCFTN